MKQHTIDDAITKIAKYIKNDISVTRSTYKRFKKNPVQSYDGKRTCNPITKATITKVIFNPPATIVFWNDNTKTVVKCREGDAFDHEKGITMAIAKKALGNKDGYYEDIKKWLPKKNREETFIKTCDNCKHDNYHFLEPCNICFTAACNGRGIRTMWESKEKPSNEKTCETCKYHNRTGDYRYGLVCSLCRSKEYWESKD